MNKVDLKEFKVPINDQGLVYAQVREKLRHRLQNMKDGEKLPSERQLSASFSINRATLRRAMLDLAKEGFIIKQQGRGTYVRRLMAQETRPATKSRIIALVVSDVEMPYHAKILKGAEEEASRQGWKIWVRNALLDPVREKEILDGLKNDEVSDVIIYAAGARLQEEEYIQRIRELMDRGKRVILLENYIPGLDAPAVIVDHVRFGYLATEHLIMLGHRAICLLSTHTYSTTGNGTYRGYCRALADYGVVFDERLAVSLDPDFCAQRAHDAVRRLVQEPARLCTAIVAQTFSMLYGAYNALTALELRLGEDVALIGSDVYHNPSLSHVTHLLRPAVEMGQAAVRLLVEDKKPTKEEKLQKHVLLPPTLVIGETCVRLKKMDKDHRRLEPVDGPQTGTSSMGR